jgi:hypothetical protein
MRSILAGLVLILSFAARAETAPLDKAKAAGGQSMEQDAVLRERINRLRDQPCAGEIVAPGLAANAASVFEFKGEDKAKVARLQEAYRAELLRRAAKWEEELNALRAEYETKISALLPEEKREPFRKVLEYSHSRWAANYNYDLAIEQGLQPLPEKSSPEQQKIRAANIAWVKEQREKQKAESLETAKNIRALLSPDETARLDNLSKPQK